MKVAKIWPLLALLLLLPGCKWAFEKVAAAIHYVGPRYDSGVPRKEGTLAGGKQIGKWTFYYEDGRKRAEGDYEDDHQVGGWTSWYENGHVEWIGRFDERGARSGAWTFYRDNGEQRATGRYGNDLEQGRWVFHGSGGRVQKAGDFQDARQVGWWSHRTADGGPDAEGLAFDGQRVGPWTRWRDGAAASEVHAVPDGMSLVRDTWPDGTLRRTGLLRSGQPIGGWATFHRDGSLRLSAVFADGAPRSFFAARRADPFAPLAEGALAGNDLLAWTAATGGAPVPQERTPLPSLPPGDDWSADDLADREPPDRLVSTWLAEVRAPAAAVAAASAPVATAPTPVAAEPARIAATRPPEWTVMEQQELDQHVQEYKVGRTTPQPSHSRYAIPQAMQGKPRRRADLEGHALPIEQLRATDGSTVQLQDYRGNKRVLLVVLRGYFGQVCVYCVAQTEALAQCHDRFDALNLEVLILYPGPEGNEQAFLDAYRETFGKGAPPYRVFYDPDLRIVKQLGIEGGDLAYPTTIFVDDAGIVRYAYTGAHRADRPAADELIKFVTSLDKP